MKMAETTKIIFNLIKAYRRIKAYKIAALTGIKIRRVYDVTIILENLDLIDIEKSKGSKAKIYVWRGTQSNGKTVKFNTNKIRIDTAGIITSISNNGTYAIVEASDKLTVQNYVGYLDDN